MIDSGNAISNGYVDFHTVYSSMVDQSLSRPATASIRGTGQRSGDGLNFNITVKNLSEPALGPANDARVWVVVYEQYSAAGSGRLTNRFVHAETSQSIATSLVSGASQSFTLSLASIPAVENWNNLRAVAIVDYLPGNGSAYDTAQAAMIPIQNP